MGGFLLVDTPCDGPGQGKGRASAAHGDRGWLALRVFWSIHGGNGSGACCEEDPGDGSLIRAALGDIARARGMAQLARDTGLSREGLYKALSKDGNPEFSTVVKVIHALGLKLHAAHV